MFAKTTFAALFAATVALAQNTTIIVSPNNGNPANNGGTNIDISFTINLPQICPTVSDLL